MLPDAVTTAAAAAAALGIEVGQIANSLVFDADGAPLLVMTSGAHRVDTGKVAAIIGADRVRRATPEFVRAATGQAIGGVAPSATPRPMRTLVDRALARVRRGLGRRAASRIRSSPPRSTSWCRSPAANRPTSPEPSTDPPAPS